MVISMDRWKGKVAIVTGASSGIGRAIAEALVGEGLQVVALARREDRLKDLSKALEDKPGKLLPFKADVTVEDEVLKAFKWTEEHVGHVSILINNAGTVRFATLTSGKTEDWKTIIDTNVLALSIATREAVKSMKAGGIDGHIIHINSILGHKVIPGGNLYNASKFAVTALTESLRHELNSLGSKIRITSISPGCVDTEIFGHAGPNATVMLEDIKKQGKCLWPEDIAEAALYVLSTPSHVQIHDLIIKPVGEVM